MKLFSFKKYVPKLIDILRSLHRPEAYVQARTLELELELPTERYAIVFTFHSEISFKKLIDILCILHR